MRNRIGRIEHKRIRLSIRKRFRLGQIDPLPEAGMQQLCIARPKARISTLAAILGHGVRAHFPVNRRHAYARLFPPKAETRVMLLFSAPDVEREPVEQFQDSLRECLGHVMIYLQSPKARNKRPDARKEWRRLARRAA